MPAPARRLGGRDSALRYGHRVRREMPAAAGRPCTGSSLSMSRWHARSRPFNMGRLSLGDSSQALQCPRRTERVLVEGTGETLV
jgi:hypothetical protein